jgi:small subunit ribosomal protein S16
MVKIRLSRHGAKKRPYYHVIVSDSESPRDGRFLEQVGTYDPSRPPEDIRLDMARIEYWLGVGALLSDRARRVLNDFKRATPPADAAPAPTEGASA